MTLEQDLKKAEAAYQTAARRAEELRFRRNALVHDALAAGWTHARIAALTGLSRGRVSQLRPKDHPIKDLPTPLDNLWLAP